MAPRVSVIIPTYNRKASVLRLLDSLRRQSMPREQFEVIVVDDGSPDDTPQIAERPFPFPFTYLRQANQGATVARNHGVEKSRGDVLVFIDDDVTVSPTTLATLVEQCQQRSKAIVMGTLIQRNDGADSIYADILLAEADHTAVSTDRQLDFPFCNTELLAVRRDDFFRLGKLQDPTAGRGWPNWDDVDFGYRAHLAGFELWQAAGAVGEHWDYSMGDWQTACRRWQRACKSAVLLFRVHPGIRPYLPMLRDKTPIEWGQDSSGLIVRKLLRAVTAATPFVWVLEQLIGLLESWRPSPRLLKPLYRWVAGNYMYRGYREGLQTFPLQSGPPPQVAINK